METGVTPVHTHTHTPPEAVCRALGLAHSEPSAHLGQLGGEVAPGALCGLTPPPGWTRTWASEPGPRASPALQLLWLLSGKGQVTASDEVSLPARHLALPAIGTMR